MYWIKAATSTSILLLLIIIISSTMGAPYIMAENTTLTSDDLEDIATALNDIQATMDTQAQAMQDTQETGQMMFEGFIMLGIIFLAFSHRHIIMDLVAAFIIPFISLNWLPDYPGVSLFLLVLSVYFFAQALMIAVKAGGAARGWSQIKGWFDRFRSE